LLALNQTSPAPLPKRIIAKDVYMTIDIRTCFHILIWMFLFIMFVFKGNIAMYKAGWKMVKREKLYDH